MPGIRGPTPISSSLHQVVTSLLDGHYVPKKERTVEDANAYRYIARHDYRLSEAFDPIQGATVRHITHKGKIMPKTEDVANIISHFHELTKGDGAEKLRFTISQYYVGISRREIQEHINQDPSHQVANTVFPNTRPLQPIIASQPMERIQADLVDLSSVICRGFRYALVVIDVHSRFLWLKPLKQKKAQLVADIMQMLWKQFGTPRYVQTDNGTEFLGKALKELVKGCNIKHITSRPNNPKAQGKCERSNRTWKKKLRFDLQRNGGKKVDWVRNLPLYAQLYNESSHSGLGGMTPFQAFFGRVSNTNCPTIPPDFPEDDLPPMLIDMDFEETQAPPSEERQSTIQEFLEQAQAAAENAKQATVKSAHKMVLRHRAKHPPLHYAVGEQVLVRSTAKDARVARGGFKLKKTNPQQGTIMAVDLARHQYHVSVEGKARWMRVDQLASLTRAKGIAKREKQQQRQPEGAREPIIVDMVENEEWVEVNPAADEASIRMRKKVPLTVHGSDGDLPPGLKNVNSSCWFNSTLQALKCYLPVPDQTELPPLLSLIAGLLAEITAEENIGSVLDVADEFQAVLNVLPNLPPGRQQDPHELLVPVLNEAVNAGLLAPLTGLYERICSVCHQSEVGQPVVIGPCMIEVEVPRAAKSVKDCIEEYLRPEILSNEDRPFCNNCDSSTEAIRSLSLTTLPSVLVVVLKRYVHIGRRLQKLNTELTINRTIDLQTDHGECCTYRVAGVQCHYGRSPRSGHYVAVCAEGEDIILFNDDSVCQTQITHEMQRSCYVVHYVPQQPSGSHQNTDVTANMEHFPLTMLPPEINTYILNLAASSERDAILVGKVCQQWHKQMSKSFLLQRHKQDVRGLLHGLPNINVATVGKPFDFSHAVPSVLDEDDPVPNPPCERMPFLLDGSDVPMGITPLYLNETSLAFVYAQHLLGRTLYSDHGGDFAMMTARAMSAFEKWKLANQKKKCRYLYLTPKLVAWAAASGINVCNRRLRNILPLSDTEYTVFVHSDF